MSCNFVATEFYILRSKLLQDYLRLKGHFHWLMPPPVATQVAGQILRYAKSAATLREAFWKVELNSTFRNGFCNLSRYVFGRCKVTLEQCFLQFVRVSRQVYPGPRGFSWIFPSWESREAANASREAARKKNFPFRDSPFRDSHSPLRGSLDLTRGKFKKNLWDQGKTSCAKNCTV